MKRLCPITITPCPGTEEAVLNLSSEAPDPMIFTGIGFTNYNPYQPPALGTNGQFIQQGCYGLATSALSQIDADALAAYDAAVCQRAQSGLPGIVAGGTSVPGGAGSTAAGAGGGPSHVGSRGGGGGGGSGRYEPTAPPSGGGQAQYSIAPLYPFMCAGVAPTNVPTYKVVGANAALYQWTFTGNPPPSLSLVPSGNNSAQLSGIPSSPGNFTYTVTATMSVGGVPVTVSTQDTVQILGITNALNETHTYDDQISYQYNAAGGQSPYAYALAQGEVLPNGLSLSASGLLSGQLKSECGDFKFKVQVTDAKGRSCQSQSDIKVTVGDITILDGKQCQTYVGDNLNDYLGNLPIATSWASSNIPDCLILSASGQITGIPIKSGNQTFQATATFPDHTQCVFNVHINVVADGNPVATNIDDLVWTGDAFGTGSTISKTVYATGYTMFNSAIRNCCNREMVLTIHGSVGGPTCDPLNYPYGTFGFQAQGTNYGTRCSIVNVADYKIPGGTGPHGGLLQGESVSFQWGILVDYLIVGGQVTTLLWVTVQYY